MNCFEEEAGKYFHLLVSVPVLNRIHSVQPANGWHSGGVVYGVGLICDCGKVHRYLLGPGRLVLGCGVYNVYAQCDQCQARGYIQILRTMGEPIDGADMPEKVMLIKLVGHFDLDLHDVDINRITWSCMVEKKGRPSSMVKRQFSPPSYEESSAGWEDEPDRPCIADMTAYFTPTSV